ncbi:MAG: hypothetical protein WCH62_09000 [Candidatus Omnitrophota bacterium]
MDKRTIPILCVLGVAVLFLWSTNPKPKGPAAPSRPFTFNFWKSTPAPAAVAPVAAVSFNKGELLDLISEEKKKQTFVYANWGERNPFDTSQLKPALPSAPLPPPPPPPVIVVKKKAIISLQLVGIFAGGQRPSAIINGDIVGVGEKVEGLIVKVIRDDAVILVDEEEKETVLSLKKKL